MGGQLLRFYYKVQVLKEDSKRSGANRHGCHSAACSALPLASLTLATEGGREVGMWVGRERSGLKQSRL